MVRVVREEAVQATLATDEELIWRFQADAEQPHAGEHADELFRRYSVRVAKWCWRFTGDREEALDLSQEVLMKAYRHLGSFRSDAKFSTWLYSITRNHCLNHIRQRAASAMGATEPLEIEPVDSSQEDAFSTLARRAEISNMHELLKTTLDERESAAMYLHYADEVPLDAVTRLLGLTNASGAKALVVSAKRKLGAALRNISARADGIGQ
jgi:RNA polymerase sigma factor (sigma-70 family)